MSLPACTAGLGRGGVALPVPVWLCGPPSPSLPPSTPKATAAKNNLVGPMGHAIPSDWYVPENNSSSTKHWGKAFQQEVAYEKSSAYVFSMRGWCSPQL